MTGAIATTQRLVIRPLRTADVTAFAAAHQGRGYATEAVRCVLDRVFGAGVHKVCAECDARNAASARLLERLGFECEGLRREHTWLTGEWTDDLLFGLLARTWRVSGR